MYCKWKYLLHNTVWPHVALRIHLNRFWIYFHSFIWMDDWLKTSQLKFLEKSSYVQTFPYIIWTFYLYNISKQVWNTKPYVYTVLLSVTISPTFTQHRDNLSCMIMDPKIETDDVMPHHWTAVPKRQKHLLFSFGCLLFKEE